MMFSVSKAIHIYSTFLPDTNRFLKDDKIMPPLDVIKRFLEIRHNYDLFGRRQ